MHTGGDASECDLYIITRYGPEGNSDICDLKDWNKDISVVNMCIEDYHVEIGSSYVNASLSFYCNGTNSVFNLINIDKSINGCGSKLPTMAPNDITSFPSPAVTMFEQLDRGYCWEYSCAGKESPRVVDTSNANKYSIFTWLCVVVNLWSFM